MSRPVFPIQPTPEKAVSPFSFIGTKVPTTYKAGLVCDMQCMDTTNKKSFQANSSSSSVNLSFSESNYERGTYFSHQIASFYAVARASILQPFILAVGNDLWLPMDVAGGTGAGSAAQGTIVRVRRTDEYSAFAHQLTITPPTVAGKTPSLAAAIDTDNIAVIYKDNTTHRLDDMRVYNITGASWSTKNAPYATNSAFADTNFGTNFTNQKFVSGRTENGFFLGCPSTTGYRIMRYRLAGNTWGNIINGARTVSDIVGLVTDPDDDSCFFVSLSGENNNLLFVEGATDVYTPYLFPFGSDNAQDYVSGNMDMSVGAGPLEQYAWGASSSQYSHSLFKKMTTSGRIEAFTDSNASGVEQKGAKVVILRSGSLLSFDKPGLANGRVNIPLLSGDYVYYPATETTANSIRSISVFTD